MSIGPEPDVNGTITVAEPCASCAGGSEDGNPENDQDYANRSANPLDGSPGG